LTSAQGDARASDGDLVEQDIAGPCCIQGDIIAHQRPLPPIQAGDILVISDVGGYYHSSYSRYNCRQAPAVIGYEYEVGSDGHPIAGSVALSVLQRAETVEESLELFRRT
jgi:diaminopimelate decarboxylase